MVGLLVHQNRGVLDRLVAPEKRVIFASLTVTLFLQMTSNNESSIGRTLSMSPRPQSGGPRSSSNLRQRRIARQDAPADTHDDIKITPI